MFSEKFGSDVSGDLQPREHERRHEGGRGYAEKNTAVHPSDSFGHT